MFFSGSGQCTIPIVWLSERLFFNMKFILFCYPRTGSTLICKALNAHPDFVFGQEMFNARYAPECASVGPAWREAVFKKCFGKSLDKLTTTSFSHNIKETHLNTIDYDYSCYLDHLFDKLDGFKIISNQIHCDSKIWDQLLDRKVKFIFLERNVEESCRSFHTSIKTRIWHSEKPVNLPPVDVDEAGIVDFTNYFVGAYNKVKMKLSTPENHIVLNYSEIADQWDSLCDKLCCFLGIKPMVLPKLLSKLGKSDIGKKFFL